MDTPQCVLEYNKIKAEYQSQGYTVPKMPPDVREFYSILEYKRRLKQIVTCKDRKSKTIDLEAYTEELAFHLKQTHSQGNNIIFMLKYHPEFLPEEQICQCSFDTNVLTPYKLYRLLKLGQKVNLYCTNCTFESNYSRKAYLAHSVENLMLDIDYYNVPALAKKSAAQVYKEICTKVFQPAGITPAYGIDSGHGLYIVFLIVPLLFQGQEENKLLYQRLMTKLLELTKQYGSDSSCKDLSRVLRLPQVINSKTNRYSHIIDFDAVRRTEPKRYSTKEICKLLKIKSEKKKPTTKKPKKVKTDTIPCERSNNKTLNSLGQARVRDLKKWLENRNYEINGKRNTFFLIYSTCLLEYMIPDSAYQKMLSVNQQLKSPQPQTELKRAFDSVKQTYFDRQKNHQDSFCFTSEYIIEALDISDHEMQSFETIITLEIKRQRDYAKRRQKRRNAEGLTQRQAAQQEKQIQIDNLLKEGKSKADIARILQVSKALVSIYSKK